MPMRALIVSAGTSSNEYLAKHLHESGFPHPTIVPSCSEAKRLLSGGSQFDIVVVNMPLPDEPGHEFGLYVTKNTRAGALLLVKASAAEQLAGRMQNAGVLVLGKPFTVPQFKQSLTLTTACARRLQGLWEENEALRVKIDQTRQIGKAKCLLIERRGMTEAEAHRYIEKSAMDNRCSRAEMAAEILDSLAQESAEAESAF